MSLTEVLQPAERIDAADFRALMAQVPTSVAVVAGMDGGHPVGLTVGTFVSVSLEPALVSVCVARTSESWPRIAPTERFSLSVLATDQQDVCAAFSAKGPDKFAAVDWELGHHGMPWVRGSVAHLDCAVEAEIVAGDHLVVVGRVLTLADGAGRSAMVFHQRRLGGVRHDD